MNCGDGGKVYAPVIDMRIGPSTISAEERRDGLQNPNREHPVNSGERRL